MFIEINDQFIEDTVRSIFSSVTGQLTGIQLKPPPTRKKRIDSPVSLVVLSKGTFKSKMLAQFPAAYMDTVVNKMAHGQELGSEEKDAYFKEYMNIFYGRFISKINNEIGHASRFVIPVLLRGAYRETADSEYANRVGVSFMSEQGKIDVMIRYEVLPEHSSN